MNKSLLLSGSDFWETPSHVYSIYMDNGYFDPCPHDPTFDGLDIAWKDRNFVNPPYSHISSWVDKAIHEYRKGNVVVMLVPSRTDTKWFSKLYYEGASFVFILGRLSFKGASNTAPFPSMLVILDHDYRGVFRVLSSHEFLTYGLI